MDYTNGHIQEHTDLILFTDGSCEPVNPGGIAISAWAIYSDSHLLAEHAQVVRNGGPQATNNFAEYCALGFALRWLLDQHWQGTLHAKSDSQLLVNQVQDKWQCKKPHLRKLRDRIWELMEQLHLQKDCISWIPREENDYADALCRQVYDAIV